MTVAVLVSRPEEAKSLVHWAGLFGRARNCDVVVLHAAPRKGSPEAREIALDGEPPTDEPVASIVAAAKRAGELLPVLPKADDEEVRTPGFTVVEVEGPEPADAVLAQLKERDGELLVLGRRRKGDEKEDEREVVERLFAHAPCPTLLIRPGDDRAETAERVLVPADRGPHAAVALDLATELASASGGSVTAVFVQTELGEDAEDLGAKKLERFLSRLSGERREIVDGRVVLASTVLEGLTGEFADHDLALLGTESPLFIRRLLSRAIPETTLSGPEGSSVAVVRRSIPLKTRFEQVVRTAVTSVVPQMDRPDRVALVDRLQTGSRFSFDFVLLTCLSTLIAALGLVAGNIAVVIGAMLVAPLMTPLIGAGLALVQGNLVFLRRTMFSVSAGFVLALGIGCLVGLATSPELTPEMRSRGVPGMLDLAVAFASGVAAAYAIGRPNLSAALPGVAIAAALVPPIATAGLALVIVEPDSLRIAAGAALLFFSNLVAIVLGSGLALFAVGVRSVHLHRRQKQWVRRLAIALFLAAAIVVVALILRLAPGTGTPA